MKRAAAILGAIAACSAVGAACLHCGDGRSTTDAGADAATPDAEPDRQLPDAGDGWRHLTEARCVGTLIATDATRVAPTIRWIPCPSGPSGCLLLDPVPFQDINGLTRVTLEVSGNAAYAKTVHRAGGSGGELQHTFYRVQDWSPLGALRFLETGCTVGGWLGDSTLVLVRNPTLAISHGDPRSVLEAPVFVELDPLPSNSIPQVFGASDTILAFDILPQQRIGRASLGQSSWTQSSGPTLLQVPIAHGGDVLAWEQYGPGQWAREHIVHADGSVSPLIDVPNHRVVGVATDESLIYWTEGYGGSPGDPQQPTIEVHAATYANDASLIGVTERKLATVPALQQPPATPARSHARSGLYAFWSGTVFVVRYSDGAWREVDVGPDWAAEDIAFVSQSDLWLNVWRRNTTTRTVMRFPITSW